MSWTCSLGWLRFTVPDANTEEVMKLVGGDWIADEKGFRGYTPGMDLSRDEREALGVSVRAPNGRQRKCMWICLKN